MVEKRSSLIHLDDDQAVGLDDSGKSPAYFCRRKPVAVTRELKSSLSLNLEFHHSRNN
jgi:hypothetical protein|tara:strand:- start:1838 stop:2011 length:174 start_codon:yes stop_codon:yes gene_type:complete